MVPAQVGQLLTHQSTQPPQEGGLVLAGELRELSDDFHQRLLNHVRKLHSLPQTRAQARANHHPEIVPVQAHNSPSASISPARARDNSSIGPAAISFGFRSEGTGGLRPCDRIGFGSSARRWLEVPSRRPTVNRSPTSGGKMARLASPCDPLPNPDRRQIRGSRTWFSPKECAMEGASARLPPS